MLALVAGYVDALSYLGLHVFVANMTGTTVLLGLAVAAAQWPAALSHTGMIACFVLGVVVSRLLRRATRSTSQPALGLAALLVGGGALLPVGLPAGYLLALGMGVQNGAATRFGGVSVNTAFLTGDLEHLGEAVAERGRRRGAWLILSVLIAYAIGAGLGGLAHAGLQLPLWPAASVLALATCLARTSRADQREAVSNSVSTTRRPRE